MLPRDRFRPRSSPTMPRGGRADRGAPPRAFVGISRPRWMRADNFAMQTPRHLTFARSLVIGIAIAAIGEIQSASSSSRGDATVPVRSAATGTVVGRVLNASNGTFLNNVRVMVEGTLIETTTDEAGEYRLLGVPEGTARITASFSGMIPQTASVSVDSGAAVRHE